MKKIVVIGAGIGGLSAAASLACAGHDVTVIEAHVYPGGCAGTFYHKGYRFDAGATLAGGFYPGGPMDLVARAARISHWPSRPDPEAMRVHLPGGLQIPVRGDEQRWAIRSDVFGEDSLPFWEWQEKTANALWELALQLPAWPPQTLAQLIQLSTTGSRWLKHDFVQRTRPDFLFGTLRPVADKLKGKSNELRQFVDAQLLISAQTTSTHANGFYGAAALDLPRRGVVHLERGIGAIATTLVEAIRRQGGKVLFRNEVTCISRKNGRLQAIQTRRGQVYPADIVIANLPPWNLKRLLNGNLPFRLNGLPDKPGRGWGAFTLYAGVDSTVIPSDFPYHHQVIVTEPLGEGNSIFLSISPEWDTHRAPAGVRALTISTHTRLDEWWHLKENDYEAYQARKAFYMEKLLSAAERVLPGIRGSINLILAGTPVTFQNFTRRTRGWVGGFPQTNLFRAWGPRITPDIYMVGDSIFPGQSIAATALGGLRVANMLGAEV
jgi:C-3',4' desaturase CrtD